MKIPIFIALLAIFAITTAVYVGPLKHKKQHLLGAKECTWGPGYWCQNITTSASCHATKHCIDTVWVHLQLPPDDSSVCQTCKDMVKEARDNLLSNGTQELIKEVFEGSCALLHVKPIVEMCDKIADEYIPEMIDTLASQMNPQVVCSVAGLCNSAKVLMLLQEAGQEKKDLAPAEVTGTTCQGCHTVMGIVVKKFHAMSKDDVLQAMLHLCGKMSSFADACSNIALVYFNEIYNHLEKNLHAEDVCLMAGECSAQFHSHQISPEITSLSKVGYVYPEDDLPCDLCEQLVGHLRDLLVANTTESEFKRVLEGLCGQTKGFKEECLSLVDQYYSIVYYYLVNNLKPKELCELGGLCPKTDKEVPQIAPLVPIQTAAETSKKIEQTQLPIELLMPPHTQNIYNKEVCLFCQYFLHFVQQEITDPKSEVEIKRIIDGACQRLPPSINSTCVQFVDMYEPALVALLAQELDPAEICPLIKACPKGNGTDVEVFMEQDNESPKCPLCLYAVSKLESIIKSPHSKDDIKEKLEHICDHLPGSMAPECRDFVDTYTDELVEMLMADLDPNEVCVYIKLCPDSRKKTTSTMRPELPVIDIDANFAEIGGDIRSNIIPDDTVNGEFQDARDDHPQCVMCEFVMSEIEHQLNNNKTDEEIKSMVRNVCKVMPKSVRDECNSFVDAYADVVIQLLIEALKPDEICAMIHLCKDKYMNAVRGEILQCAVCQGSLEGMKRILGNPNADHSVGHVLEKTCRGMPKKFRSQCTTLVDEYGPPMVVMLKEGRINQDEICRRLSLCSEAFFRPLGFY